MKTQLLHLSLFTLILSGCTENFFDETANKETPEAIFFQAEREINARNYAEAIALLESLDPDYILARHRRPIYASAYSGRCGLEFLSLLEALQDNNSDTVLGMLMSSFPGAEASNVEDCVFSSSILQDIGDESERNGDENLLLAFTSLAKMGTILSSLADQDDDGQADAGFDQCDDNDLPDERVRQLGSSLAVTLLSLSAIGASYIDSTLDDISTLCNQDPNLEPFCNTTDPSSFSSNEVQAFRYAIGSSDYGINSCGGLDFTDCAMSNPSCP